MRNKIDFCELNQALRDMLAGHDGGMEITIMNGEKPIARIVPISAKGKRLPGLHPGAITILEDINKPLPDEFWDSPTSPIG
jgi:antitoxin (DNA-binding transcriptional repressor) of toxin-antitoxin stability system